jgi:hypothetical protein
VHVPDPALEDLPAALEEASPVSASIEARLAPWFEKRRWRVMAEKTGTVTIAGVKYAYDRGAFEISPPGVFVTPLGHRGRKGILIIETGEDGADIPGSEVAFGETALRRAQRAHGTISGLPEEQR